MYMLACTPKGRILHGLLLRQTDHGHQISIIGVAADLSPANVANLGDLKAISPEEPRHALVFAIARDIDNGMSDEQLMPWKSVVNFGCHRIPAGRE